MQYAAEVKFLKIEMKNNKNLQRSKHGLKTCTRFYLEERENIFELVFRTHRAYTFSSREGFLI